MSAPQGHNAGRYAPAARGVLRLAFALLSVALGMALAQAPASPRSPTPLPQARVVQDMHTAPMDQMRADAQHERLVTIASDKTVRIWRLADLKLLRTVYLPAEPGVEGTPYAVAISADGGTAYVAAVTGWSWRRASQIYVIDLGTGLITGTVGRFDNDIVTAMDLSPDGQRLAVGLYGGVLVTLNLAMRSVLFSDREYARRVTFVHHAPDGRLVTSSDDGCMRVYAPDGKLIHRAAYPPQPATEKQCTGSEMGGVRFSPDGRWIALGTGPRQEAGRWAPEVPIFDAHTFAIQRVVRAEDADQRSLCCIAWAPDSGTLFVNGTAEGERPTPLYRIRNPLTGPLERWNVGREQFTNMLPLRDGSVVFATTAPSLARVGVDGALMPRSQGGAMEALPDNIDFHRTRNDVTKFVVAPDGSAVSVEATPGRWLRLSLLNSDPSQVLTWHTARADASVMRGARRQGAVNVRTAVGLLSYKEPTTVNDQPVAFAAQEGVRSWAVHPRLALAAFGTQRRLHVVDAQGKPAVGWQEPPHLPAPIYHTAFTEDGRWLVVAVGDGTVRWFDVATGQERLGAFVSTNSSDWVAWRPDGYYASSPNGDRYIGWLVNRSETASPDFFSAVQFERALYRPDLVRSTLNTATAVQTAGKQEQLLADTIAALAAPRVRIEQVNEATREVRFTVEAMGRPVREVGLFADGIPVLAAAQRIAQIGAGDKMSRTVAIPSSLALDRIRVEAESENALGVDELAVLRPKPPEVAKGRLWVLAIGVDRFDELAACKGPGRCPVVVPPLPNAPSDASVLAGVLQRRLRSTFSDVLATVLTHKSGSAPTKQSILDALHGLKDAGAGDTVLVFIASHGFVGGGEVPEYYFLPSDVQTAAIEKLTAEAQGRQAPTGASMASLLSASELTAALRGVAGRRILVIDTCHAGAAGVSTNPYSLAKRSAAAQFAVLSASTGSELSYEVADAGVPHGAFTYALIRALEGSADKNSDGVVTLDEAFAYVTPVVKENTNLLNQKETRRNPRHQVFTQTPVLYAPKALRDSRL